jgi:RimJ/RimL family protein N-acetyltransferase
MAADLELTTPRLVLRRWRDEDRVGFAAMNGDPEVMEHFPALLTREESDRMIDRIEALFDEDGFGWWAVTDRTSGVVLGLAGISRVRFEAPFTPAVEVGWRFARSSWGHGYATEAASAALDHGFGVAGLEEIVAVTVPRNARSLAVMERLGMRRDPDADFDHPNVPDASPLRRHVLYRHTAADWRARRAAQA